MYLNLYVSIIKKPIAIFSALRLTSVFFLFTQIEESLSFFFEQETLAKYLRLNFLYYTTRTCFYLIYTLILNDINHYKLNFFLYVNFLFSKSFKFIVTNLVSLATKNHMWLKYGFKILKTWKMSGYFSLVLFTVSTSRYNYLVNKRKYFQFKRGETYKLTPFICQIFEMYLKELRNFNPLAFKKITLLNDLSHFGKISRFFNFSLKHIECFKKIYAFTLLAIPYMMFYSFLLDQTYIWSGLINELQVYFQKGFI
jgi:hypothetical protein